MYILQPSLKLLSRTELRSSCRKPNYVDLRKIPLSQASQLKHTHLSPCQSVQTYPTEESGAEGTSHTVQRWQLRFFLTHAITQTFGNPNTPLFLWVLLNCLEGDTGGLCWFVEFKLIMYLINEVEASNFIYLNTQEVYAFSLEIC